MQDNPTTKTTETTKPAPETATETKTETVTEKPAPETKTVTTEKTDKGGSGSQSGGSK